MNKYIITAREIERMLNLAAMEEAGCLSRAGKEELNELVARVQEVIDELAAWWKEIKRIKEEIKAKNAEAKNKGEKTDSVPRLDYSPQEHAATYWLRPIIDKGVGGMTLVVADGWVDQMRRIGFTMNGVELSVCRFEQYAKLMEKAWNNGKQARRMIHNGGTCDCVMPLEFVKRQKGAEEGECDQDSPIGEGGSQKRNQVKEEYEYKEEGEDKQQKSLLTKCANRDTCHESFADLCEETYCKLNRSLSVHEADNLQYVQSVLRTLGGEWLRWIRKSKGIPVRPDLLAKSIKCDDPRLVPIIRFLHTTSILPSRLVSASCWISSALCSCRITIGSRLSEYGETIVMECVPLRLHAFASCERMTCLTRRSGIASIFVGRQRCVSTRKTKTEQG